MLIRTTSGVHARERETVELGVLISVEDERDEQEHFSSALAQNGASIEIEMRHDNSTCNSTESAVDSPRSMLR
ncbi:hypothetical protein ACVWWG_001827 [Bradyrhizobium sp. LB7.2]